ncbi:uncharacterized protein FN964_011654 [Alca torda]
MERDRQGLLEQLSEARSVKETLESSLFEAQQHLSELEITRSHLEIQLHTVAQAKEVIQGEVKCLQWELEAERFLLKQERENMAQELLQKERQHNDTLKLRETDHKVEINKVLQDVFKTVPPRPMAPLPDQESLPSFPGAPLGTGRGSKVSPGPLLLQAEHPQLSQPVLTAEGLQLSDHLRGLLWTHSNRSMSFCWLRP